MQGKIKFGWAVLLLLSLPAIAKSQDGATRKNATLEERLTFALKVRRPAEKKFIKRVVQLVKAGQLKRKTVDESFFWVRKEIEKRERGAPGAREHIAQYPFFYFERVLKLNAKREGVIIN